MKTLNDFYRLFPGHSVPATQSPVRATVAPSTTVIPVDEPARNAPRYRARDIGVGYGRSSGYAQSHSYTAGRAQGMLRVG